MKKKGLFITFEGVEGCGKTTQLNILEKYLKKLKIPVIKTKEPGGTKFGKKIRNILLQSNINYFIPYTELFLFAADRLEHVEKVINPELRKDKIILCDRYIDSTIAYQIGGRKLNEKIVKKINDISSSKVLPDLTIIFDIEIKEGLKRATKIGHDRIEKESILFHKRVAKKYIEISRRDKKRIKVIKVDGKSINKVHKEVLSVVENYIKSLKNRAILDKINK